MRKIDPSQHLGLNLKIPANAALNHMRNRRYSLGNKKPMSFLGTMNFHAFEIESVDV